MVFWVLFYFSGPSVSRKASRRPILGAAKLKRKRIWTRSGPCVEATCIVNTFFHHAIPPVVMVAETAPSAGFSAANAYGDARD